MPMIQMYVTNEKYSKYLMLTDDQRKEIKQKVNQMIDKSMVYDVKQKED